MAVGEPGAGPSNSGLLDKAPPQPPGGRKRASSLMDSQNQSQGLGPEGGNPQILILQGLAMMEKGSQMLSGGLPQLGPALNGLMQNLKQVVPQAMADQLSGNPGAGALQPAAGGPAAGGGPPPPAAPPTVGGPAGAMGP